MIHEQQQIVAMRGNIRGCTHGVFVNILRSHLLCFCAAGDSSSLATRMIFTSTAWGKLGESIIQRNSFCFHFCTVWHDCCLSSSLNSTLVSVLPYTLTEHEWLMWGGSSSVWYSTSAHVLGPESDIALKFVLDLGLASHWRNIINYNNYGLEICSLNHVTLLV
jgi:hypothetical protein